MDPSTVWGPRIDACECDTPGIALPLYCDSWIPVKIIGECSVFAEQAHGYTEEPDNGWTGTLWNCRQDTREIGEGNGQIFISMLSVAFWCGVGDDDELCAQ